MNRRYIPNLITVLRFLLVAPLVWYLWADRYGAALSVALVAGVSDALDGFLAKRYGWESRLGGILDPLADKLLLVCSFIMLGLAGLIPMWLVVLALFRDLVIVVGATLFHTLIVRVEPEPTPISKINTTCQILLVLVVLLAQLIVWLPGGLVDGLVILVAVTTLASGGHYVWAWGRLAWRLSSPEAADE